jgi:hypothetical protein
LVAVAVVVRPSAAIAAMSALRQIRMLGRSSLSTRNRLRPDDTY